MTDATLNEFLDRLRSDAELRRELRALAGERPSLPADEMVSFGAARGYWFTVEGLTGELSDRALEAVAGGTLTAELLTGEDVTRQSPLWLAWKPGKKS